MDIRLPDGTKEFAQLGDDGQLVRDSVIRLCQKYELEGESYVLTRKVHGERQLLGTWDALSAVPGDVQVSLVDYGDILAECLDTLHKSPRETLVKLMKFLNADEHLGEEFLKRDGGGISILLKLFLYGGFPLICYSG